MNLVRDSVLAAPDRVGGQPSLVLSADVRYGQAPAEVNAGA